MDGDGGWMIRCDGNLWVLEEGRCNGESSVPYIERFV